MSFGPPTSVLNEMTRNGMVSGVRSLIAPNGNENPSQNGNTTAVRLSGARQAFQCLRPRRTRNGNGIKRIHRGPKQSTVPNHHRSPENQSKEHVASVRAKYTQADHLIHPPSLRCDPGCNLKSDFIWLNRREAK